jgi:hypothetical protein
MVLWKKTSSGQGDPPGPLGKYITMYNKAVKTLGTDNPEVLKNFFASQQYGQNNTQVQQNNNINKAPQPKESKIGNVAGDVGTLALSTLQNFGMNIPGDVIKTVAPKAAILDVLPQTTTNQYVKQRNQSLGQNIKDVGDAANTVAAFEVGTPLVGKAIQTGVKYVKPYVKPVVNTIKNRLFRSKGITDNILNIDPGYQERLLHLENLKNKKLIHSDTNIEYYARSEELTNNITKEAINHRNTYYRGVEPKNIHELDKKSMIEQGIDINDDIEVGKYMASHIPYKQLDYASGFYAINPNHNALYTSSGYSGYGTKTYKLFKPTDFTKGNYSNWLEDLYKYESYDPNTFKNIEDIPKWTRAYRLSSDIPDVFVGKKGQKIFDDVTLVTDEFGRTKALDRPGYKDIYRTTYPSSNGEPLLKMRNPFKKEPIIIPEEYIPSDKIKQKSSVVLNDSELPKKIEPFSINEQNYPNVKYNVYKEPNLTSIFPNNGIVEYPGIKKYAVDITNFYEKSPNVVNNRLNRIQWHVDKLENEPISLIKKNDYKMNFWGTKNIEKEKYLFPHNTFEEKIRTIDTQKQILRNVEENKPILDNQLKYANEKELKAIKDFDRERLHQGDYSLLFTPDFDSPPTLFGKSDAGRYYKGWNAPSELRNKAFLSRTNNPTETLEAGLHELGHMSNHNKNYFSSRDKLVIENVIDNSKTNNSELKDALKEFTYEEIMADTRPLRFAMGDLDGSLKYTPDMLDNFFTKSNKAVLPSRMKKLFDLGVLDTEQLSKVLNTYKSFVPGVVTTGTGLSLLNGKINKL